MSEEIKFSDEAYQLLIRYEAARDQAVDCNTLALVLGTKYKGAWDKINKAKKSLIATGLQVPTGAAGTPKKRKNDGENEADGAVIDGGKEKSPIKGGASKGKKAEKVDAEEDDEESGLPQAKRVKKEAVDEE